MPAEFEKKENWREGEVDGAEKGGRANMGEEAERREERKGMTIILKTARLSTKITEETRAKQKQKIGDGEPRFTTNDTLLRDHVNNNDNDAMIKQRQLATRSQRRTAQSRFRQDRRGKRWRARPSSFQRSDEPIFAPTRQNLPRRGIEIDNLSMYSKATPVIFLFRLKGAQSLCFIWLHSLLPKYQRFRQTSFAYSPQTNQHTCNRELTTHHHHTLPSQYTKPREEESLAKIHSTSVSDEDGAGED